MKTQKIESLQTKQKNLQYIANNSKFNQLTFKNRFFKTENYKINIRFKQSSCKWIFRQKENKQFLRII